MSGISSGDDVNAARMRTQRTEGAWLARYLGGSYRKAVERGLARVSADRPVVLKTDLWNECLGAPRDVLGRLAAEGHHRLFAVELSHPRCLEARLFVPQALAVVAHITTLPFRAGSVDLLLDLSTIDHVSEAEVAAAIGEYARVLGSGGVLVLVSWQRNALVRLRLWLKRCLGIPDDPGQHYHSRKVVRSLVARGLTVAEEFAAGTLLVLPMRATRTVLGVLPQTVTMPLLDFLVRLEHRSPRFLPRLAGLYGLVAVKDAERSCGRPRAGRSPGS